MPRLTRDVSLSEAVEIVEHDIIGSTCIGIAQNLDKSFYAIVRKPVPEDRAFSTHLITKDGVTLSGHYDLSWEKGWQSFRDRSDESAERFGGLAG